MPIAYRSWACAASRRLLLLVGLSLMLAAPRLSATEDPAMFPDGPPPTDACGISGGDGTTCLPGCDGVPYSGLQSDQCGVCGGDGMSCLGCNGVPFSDARLDQCGICGGDNSSCAGCDGLPFSGMLVDACGICGGDNSSCAGCDGIASSGARVDACGVCGGDGSSCAGCDGIAHSAAVVDACGVCGGDGSSCAGCDGIAHSASVVDACGVCGGDGSSCAGCDGIAHSAAVVDTCGVCGGDNTSCEAPPAELTEEKMLDGFFPAPDTCAVEGSGSETTSASLVDTDSPAPAAGASATAPAGAPDATNSCYVCRYQEFPRCATISTREECYARRQADLENYDCAWENGRCESRFKAGCEASAAANRATHLTSRVINRPLNGCDYSAACRHRRYRYWGHSHSFLCGEFFDEVSVCLDGMAAAFPNGTAPASLSMFNDGCSTFQNAELVQAHALLLQTAVPAGFTVVVSGNQTTATMDCSSHMTLTIRRDGVPQTEYGPCHDNTYCPVAGESAQCTDRTTGAVRTETCCRTAPVGEPATGAGDWHAGTAAQCPARPMPQGHSDGLGNGYWCSDARRLALETAESRRNEATQVCRDNGLLTVLETCTDRYQNNNYVWSCTVGVRCGWRCDRPPTPSPACNVPCSGMVPDHPGEPDTTYSTTNWSCPEGQQCGTDDSTCVSGTTVAATSCR